MDARNLKAINGNVVVMDDKKKEITSGGIVLPKNAESNRVICGTVLDVSPFLLEDGSWMDPPIINGNKVIYTQHAGAASTWLGEDDRCTYRLVKWNEIQAINYEKSE